MQSNKNQPEQPQTADQQPQPQQQQQKKKKKSKKPAKKPLNDPKTIIEDVLAKSSFKVPNLSQIVDEKFYGASDYKAQVSKLLKNITYKSTVGPTTDGCIEQEMSVLPIGFKGRVELPITAITSLSCINKQADSRKWRRGPKKGKKNKSTNDGEKTKENTTNKAGATINSDKIHQIRSIESGESRQETGQMTN